MRTKLLTALHEYAQTEIITLEEQPVLQRFLDFVEQNPQCFDRANPGHITSSVWIVSSDKKQALLTHHKKLGAWFQLGGHNDGDADCKAVALKEAHEESGMTGFMFLVPGIFDIDIHAIPSSCLYHYDIRYLLQAPANSSYIVSEESHDLAWVDFENITKFTTQRSVVRLHEKMQRLLAR